MKKSDQTSEIKKIKIESNESNQDFLNLEKSKEITQIARKFYLAYFLTKNQNLNLQKYRKSNIQQNKNKPETSATQIEKKK